MSSFSRCSGVKDDRVERAGALNAEAINEIKAGVKGFGNLRCRAEITWWCAKLYAGDETVKTDLNGAPHIPFSLTTYNTLDACARNFIQIFLQRQRVYILHDLVVIIRSHGQTHAFDKSGVTLERRVMLRRFLLYARRW
jgi:hypothetical protein